MYATYGGNSERCSLRASLFFLKNSYHCQKPMNMKTITLTLFFLGLVFSGFSQVEYKVVTSIESVVPMGIGRSRIIQAQEEIDHSQLTTERTDGTKTKQGSVRRRDAKIDNLEETKLLNFYSATGINFQNIASNDAIITNVLNTLTGEGWELAFVVSGVESDAGKPDGNGIFITRYIFKRPLYGE